MKRAHVFDIICAWIGAPVCTDAYRIPKQKNNKFKIMKHLFISLFWAISTMGLTGQNFNANLSAKLDYMLDSLVTYFTNTEGMAAGVYVPGQGIWTGASGWSHAGVPITTDMEFGLASNSKLFTAVVLLKLAEDNVLSLEDPLSMWIPSFANINSSITIRQLLNHTSGVSDPFFTTGLLDFINTNPTYYFTPEEVLGWVGAPLFAPGTGYGYSNANYILAGMVAHSATGIPIAQLIRTIILDPLGLAHSFYDIEEAELGTIAHRWDGGVDMHNVSRISLNTAGGPAGSLFSTAADMAQWFRDLMSGQVINENSMAEMTSFESPGNYGLGIALFTFFGHPCWGHGGSTTGYKSRTIYDPCMQAAVIGLSNSNPSAVDGITAKLYEVLTIYLPACATAISGNTTVCAGTPSVTYTLPAIANASSYVWTLPPGATGASNTNTITVNYGNNASSGEITVRGSNEYGEGSAASLYINVTINPQPVIWGVQNSCADQVQTYTTTAGAPGTIYEWNITNGSILSGCGENDISCTVQWNEGSTGTINLTTTTP